MKIFVCSVCGEVYYLRLKKCGKCKNNDLINCEVREIKNKKSPREIILEEK